jgi:sporulation protein YlmC with PRC-barrel domain
MRTLEDVQTWRGKKVIDADGDKIGTIEDVFLDRHTGAPEWATVKTGLFGLKSSYVPIRDAELMGEDEVRVPFQKEQVKDAPKVDADGELSADEERRLWEHYGRSDYDEWQGDDRTTQLGLPDDGSGQAPPGGETPPVVGVRLRRVVIVAVAPGAARRDDPAARS